MADNPQQRTEAEQLREFVQHCALFVAPMVLLAVPAIGILAISGESFINVDKIVRASDDRQFLVGFAYNERNYGYLKYRRLTSLPRQSIVALGSSRVIGFREEMFTESFYNAGYTIRSPWDFRSFLKLIPEAQLPEVLILGLDQFMFNEATNHQRQPQPSTDWTERSHDDLQAVLRLVPDVYRDFVRGRIRIPELLAHAITMPGERETIPVGMNGLMNGKGFRNDGSFRYGLQIEKLLQDSPQARDYRFTNTLARVHRGVRLFDFADSVDPAAIAEIEQLLAFCRNRDVHVVAFLPPYANVVWKAMRDSGRFEYALNIEACLRSCFNRHGFELYSFHSMKDCGVSDLEAIDGFHAGECAYVRMLIQMVQNNSVLDRYTDLSQLRNISRWPYQRYLAYPEPRVKSRLVFLDREIPRR